MNSFSKRLMLPALGLVLVIAVVAQARGLRVVSGDACAPDGSPSAKAEGAPGDSQPLRIRGEGRVASYPGGQVAIGTELGGRLVKLHAEEGQRIERGALIAEIDTSELRPQLNAAVARVHELEADVQLLSDDLTRTQTLTTLGATSLQTQDHAVHARASAAARLDGAKADVERLRALIGKARVLAPIAGVVIARSAEPGEIVSAGRVLATIADLDRVRIEAEIDEFDSARVTLGSQALVRAEGYGDQGWSARVIEIPSAVSGRKLKPQDPGRPEDTRVLLVKLALDGKTPLRLGQRVEIALDVARSK
jgi:RND family efflux transporter MFP subunit